MVGTQLKLYAILNDHHDSDYYNGGNGADPIETKM